MKQIVCSHIPKLTQYLDYRGCMQLDLVVCGILMALIVMAYFIKIQCRRTQRRRGGSCKGSAVRGENGKWEYTFVFTLPWIKDVYLRLRPGYVIADMSPGDLDAFKKELGRGICQVREAGWVTKVIGFDAVLVGDRTKIKARPRLYRRVLNLLGIRNRYGDGRVDFGCEADGSEAEVDIFSGSLGIAAGKPKGGKTIFLKTLVERMSERLKAVEIVIWDGQDMWHPDQFPYARLISGMEDLRDEIKRLNQIKREREAILRQANVVQWEHLKVDCRVVPIVLVLDEAHHALSPRRASRKPGASQHQQISAEIQLELIEDLVREGRKVGITIIAGSQMSLQDEWSLHFTLASCFRFATSLPSESSSSAFLEGDPRAADQSLRNGRSVLLDHNGVRLVRVYHYRSRWP